MKDFVLIIGLCVVVHCVSAQHKRESDYDKKQNLDSVFSENGLSRIAELFYNEGWVKFRGDLDMKPESIFSNHKELFGLSVNDEMELTKVTEDDFGYSHYRYRQLHHGIPIEGMTYIIHSKDGKALHANGDLIVGLDLSKEVIKQFKEYRYHEMLIELGLSSDDSTGQLVIVKRETNALNMAENFDYRYQLLVQDRQNESSFIYIDPSKCEITGNKKLKRSNTSPTYNGTCYTSYNGQQIIKTYYRDEGGGCIDYYIPTKEWWDFDGNFYQRRDMGTINVAIPTNSGSPCFWATERPKSDYRDGDNIWPDNDNAKPYLSAFWAFQKAVDYFDSEWDTDPLLNGYYGNEMNYLIKVIDRSSPVIDISPNIASVSGYPGTWIMEIPKSINGVSGPMVSLDVIGHEATHMLLLNTLGDGVLTGSGENGAIEEGLCDVFGNLIQMSIEGYNHNDIFTLAEDPILAGTSKHKRSLSNPKSQGMHSTDANCSLGIGQPDTYLGQYWETRPCNGNGIHTNNGIFNYWFYLLAMGGNGVNDNNDVYDVDGVGLNVASDIIFRFAMNYLTTGTVYIDARNATVQIAHDYYGPCSEAHEQTLKAWDAVGVPSQGPYGYEDKVVDCSDLNMVHSWGLPYEESAVNSIEIGCSVGSGKTTILESGGTITLMPGFSYGKDGYLKLNPIPCDITY